MRVDVRILQEWFSAFNDRYFGGRLPEPSLSTGMSRTRLGSMAWRRERRLFRSVNAYAIRISNYYDADEIMFKSVLLHEMIHLYIVANRLHDTSPHGEIFRSHMERINADGWRISVSARMEGVAQARRAVRRRGRVVLVAVTKGNKHVVSVVSPKHVMAIDRVMRMSPDVKSYSWHISTDDYFSAFPVVRTPKGRVVTQETYERLLAGMKALKLPY